MKTLFHSAAISVSLAAVFFTGCATEQAPKKEAAKPAASKAIHADLNQNCKASVDGSVVATAWKEELDDDDEPLYEFEDIKAGAAQWSAAPCTSVMLYPQRTVETNDKAVNEAMASASGIEAKVKAMYNDEKIALMVYWADTTKSMQDGTGVTYADGFAVQMPKETDAAKLPYIGMGSDDRPVMIYLQKNNVFAYEPNGNGDVYHQQADQSKNLFGTDLWAYHHKVAKMANKDYQRLFVAEGFRSTTEVREEEASFDMAMNYSNGQWQGTLMRNLSDDHNELGATFPIALAVWDGGKANRDGQKWLSSWVSVKIGEDASNALSEQLNFVPKGDVANGKKLAIENCAACHIFDDQAMTSPYMAPGLSTIGGQATADYIKESIVDPNAVVVPGYNRNAHPNYQWYTVADGQRFSTMPPFDWMPEDQINDLVAYFKTLK